MSIHVFDAVTGAMHAAVDGLAALLTPIAGTLDVALAIVVLTLLVRLLISPLTYVQVRGERRRAALAPQIEKLRAKHRDDPMALATETLALQRANGASPFTALLPALAQAPFFMLMYHLALTAPAGAVLGVPLTAHLLTGAPVPGVLLVFGGLLALAAGLAWRASRRARDATPAIVRFLPYLSVLAVAWMPLAGGLYLVTSASWTALENRVLRRQVTTGNR